MDSRSKWGQPDGFHPNGLVLDEDDSPIRRLDPERWAIAEERTAELIACIRPNWLSEKHRMAVASYVQRLITQCVPCQVFTFGSVPLKTYLPDGDIDLTAFSEDQNVKDKWANEVRDMLKREEKNEQAEFQVKEVQYIQAEVKIIKCLVDNIVVDISFNQLGGLCTLCFLEEIDNLINQNHLFKRSIILIKAWCYYESRLLGAHHGLISTYALETLVLYIFHVFNNSFAGPFEVLYRFLEFFSKFDWANFCVSLWGPVPISSLPSMAAEPPRRDGGDLLLNKMFLSACSTAYSVFPGGQENREQPFIAKHFNVVDPLRINNNLGRSVSKGNFYRIRTAFSLGAEQLARILDCQEDSIVTEVNQFFVNTWKRHGHGCRPDAPILDAFHLRQVDSGQDRSLGKQTSRKKATENVVSHGPDMKQSHCFLGSAMQPDKISVNPIVGITDSHRDASGWAHQNTQRSNLSKKLQNEEIYRMDILHNRAHTMHQFARTCSSPELTNLSSEATSSCRRNVGTGEVEDDTTVKSNHARRARDPGMENLFVQHSMDEAHISESPSCHDRLTSFGLKHSFGNTDKSISGSARPACFSGDDRSLSHEEVQDFMNRVSSSGIQSNGACVQMPANLASHPLLPFMPPIVGYNHHNVGGTIPADLASHEPDWGSVMHYPDGLFPAPFSQHFNAMGVAPDQEEMVGRLKGSTFSAEAEHQDDDYGYWTDSNTDSVRGVEPECEEFSTASSRLSPTSPTTSSRTKASSESSWDGKPPRRTNALRHNLGNVKHCFQNPVDGGWRVGGEPADQICDDADDDCKIQVPFSTAEPLATSVTSSRAEVHQLPGFGPPHTPYPNSMFPFTPLLVRPGSQQGVSQNHAVLPVAFYPAGPPVPFFAMVPFCNLPNGTGTSGTPTCQHDAEAEKSTLTMGQSASGCSSDSANNPERSSLKTHNYKSMDRAVSGEDSGETGSDIFDSDFASHWKNLQYGRLCQNSRLWHPLVYPPPVVVMPQHLQGHLPFDPPENLSPRTSNTFVNLVPASAMQPASCKPTGVSQRYSAEVSIHRNGTGTYFPNPKIIRDRQISTSRQYQGDWNNDRDEQLKDREANWHFNSKPRFSGRAQARYHYEKPTIKMDRSSTSQIDRPWDTFSRNSNRSYRFPNGPSTSRPAHNGPDNVDYSVHPMRSAHLNEDQSIL